MNSLTHSSPISSRKASSAGDLLWQMLPVMLPVAMDFFMQVCMASRSGLACQRLPARAGPQNGTLGAAGVCGRIGLMQQSPSELRAAFVRNWECKGNVASAPSNKPCIPFPLLSFHGSPP
jgi:hypothetical protein